MTRVSWIFASLFAVTLVVLVCVVVNSATNDTSPRQMEPTASSHPTVPTNVPQMGLDPAEANGSASVPRTRPSFNPTQTALPQPAGVPGQQSNRSTVRTAQPSPVVSSNAQPEPLDEDDSAERPSEPPTGSLAKVEIRAAIDAVRPQVIRCFEEALRGNPNVAGRIRVSFEIGTQDGEGIVLSGEVPESETSNPFLDACVLNRIRGIKVPAPIGGNGRVAVNYPFVFRNAPQDHASDTHR